MLPLLSAYSTCSLPFSCFRDSSLLFLLANSLLLTNPIAAANTTLDDTAVGWSYSPIICDGACDNGERGWWQLANVRDAKYMTEFYGGTETATNIIGATATLQFLGTDIWYYTSRSPQGGIMDISLDGNVTSVSSILPAGSKIVRQQLVWSAHGLDGSVKHELKVTMTGGVIIGVDRVDVTLPERPVITDPSTSPDPSPSTSAENSGGAPRGLKLAAIISGVICSIFLVILLVVGIYYFWRRKRQRQAYRRVDAIDQYPHSKPLPPLPPYSGNTSVVAVNSAEHETTQLAQVLPAWSPTAMTASEATHGAFSPFDPTAPVTFRPGPARQDGPLLRYALVRTASMRPVTLLVEGDEHERDPLSARSRYRSGQRYHPPPLPTIPSTRSQSPTGTTTEVQFTPYRHSQSEEVDLLALAIQRDDWPQPPSHIPALSPISSADTATPATTRSRTNVPRYRAGSYSIPDPPSRPPPAPPTQTSPYVTSTTPAHFQPPH